MWEKEPVSQLQNGSKNSIALPIIESSQVGEARRIAIALAKNLNFNETELGKVGIVVTELANNLLLYAQDGQLLLQTLFDEQGASLEILSLDKGPGITNISECLQDGYSTGRTPGNGMGAIKRLSSVFDIYSVASEGTAIFVKLSPIDAVKPSLADLLVGTACSPKLGEEVSGDGWTKIKAGDRILLLVVDGLGHGILAAEASQQAVRVVRTQSRRSPQEILEIAHTQLRSTRGAAMAVAEINLLTHTVRFAGVGNISATILHPGGNCNLVSYNGTVGHEARKIAQFNYLWPKSATLIMHSDGLGTQWNLERYPGLIGKHPSLIAGVLHRDFKRDRDDVTVLVGR